MAIWEYKNNGPRPTLDIIKTEKCIFCASDLKEIKSINKENQVGTYRVYKYHVMICPICGWWRVHQFYESHGGELVTEEDGAYASLRNLDLSNTEQPIEEVQSFLLANYESRYKIHPRLYEKVVASVFSNLGYRVQVTGYSNDGGIDVILESGNGQLIGVQVKRYRSRIKVEQIRSLAGALLLGRYTKGIFVTTSSFQAGAAKAASLSAFRGIPIELMNAERFLDALRISRRPLYSSLEEWEQVVGKIELSPVWSDYA